MNESALIDDNLVEYLAKAIMRCVDKHAPESQRNKLTSEQSWITNGIKNRITKRAPLFQKRYLVQPKKTIKRTKLYATTLPR